MRRQCQIKSAFAANCPCGKHNPPLTFSRALPAETNVSSHRGPHLAPDIPAQPAERYPFLGSKRGRPHAVSLRLRLVAFAVLAMTLVAAERLYSIVRLHSDNLAAAQDHVLDLMERGVSQFGTVTTEGRAVLSTLAAMPGTVPLDRYSITPSDADPLTPDPGVTPEAPSFCQGLAKVAEGSAVIEAISIIAPNGVVRCSTNAAGMGLDVNARDYFRIAMRGIPTLESVARSYATGMPGLYAAQPVVGEEGEVSAVLLARIGLNDLLPRRFLAELGAAAQVMLVGPEGTVIMAYPDRSATLGSNLADTAPVARAMSRTRGTLLAAGPDDVRRVYAYSRLPGTNLHLLVGVDERRVIAPVERATFSAGLALLVLGFIILVTFWVIGERLIVAPVQSLADRLVRFGRGEPGEAPTAHTLITELQPLVTAFEAMSSELTRRESALRNANHRLNSLASLDPLTGIANRRSFDAALALQWNTVSQLAVLMIDIDKFKAFNDLYGHKEGDGCIRLVAQTMASTLRGTDLVARLGGEEFAVLMPSASLRAATEAAQRLRRAVETVAIPHRGGPAGVVTVSIGCAACEPEPGLTSSDLMVAADRALYEAKAAGRNEVRVAGAVQPSAGSTRLAPI